MSILRNLPDDVTVIEAASTTDEYGNASRSWATATETTVKGWLQRGASTEAATRDRESVSTGGRVFLPTGTAITARSRVRVDGKTWEVDGTPETLRTPRGPRLVRANVKRLEG